MSVRSSKGELERESNASVLSRMPFFGLGSGAEDVYRAIRNITCSSGLVENVIV